MSKRQREEVKSQNAALDKEMSAIRQTYKAKGEDAPDHSTLLKEATKNVNENYSALGLPLIPEKPPEPEPPVTDDQIREAEAGIRKLDEELAAKQPSAFERMTGWKPEQKLTEKQQEKRDNWQALLARAASERQAAAQQAAPAAMQQYAPLPTVMPTPTGGPVMATPGGMPEVGGLQQMAPKQLNLAALQQQQKTPEEAAIDAEVAGILSRPHQPMPPMVRVPSSATPETMRQFAEANGIPQQAPAPPQKVMLPRDLKERASVVRQSAQSLDNSQIASAALKAKPEEARQVLASLKDALQERAKSLERGADADPMLLKRITTLGRMLISLTAVPSR